MSPRGRSKDRRGLRELRRGQQTKGHKEAETRHSGSPRGGEFKEVLFMKIQSLAATTPGSELLKLLLRYQAVSGDDKFWKGIRNAD